MSDAIRNAGAKLANIAFNLAQRKDLPADILACLDASRKEWDEAVRAPSAPVAPDGQKVELMRSGLALMVELKKVKADHAKVLEEAYGALLWLHRRLPAAYKPLATIDQTIESIGSAIGYDARESLAERAALSVKAEPSTVEKMLATSELDELGEEVARLQRALCFWLPSVTEREDEVAIRILEDAFLLVGIDGNIPDDFKSAQELGWVTLAAAPTPPLPGEAT